MVDYGLMTIKELRDYAAEKKIKIKSSMKKSIILQRVLTHDFEHMTLPELKQYANLNGFNIPPKADRDEICNIVISEIKTRAMGEPGLTLLEKHERSLFVDPGRFVSVGNYIKGYEDLSIFTVCPKCGEEVLGKYYVISENAYKTDSTIVNAFAKCPRCKCKLGLDDTRTIAFLDYNNPTSGFKTLHDSVRESKREASLDIIQKYVDNLQKNKDMPSDNQIAVKIRSSKKDLKKYILYLIHIESEIYYLKERFSSLQAEEDDNQQSACRTKLLIQTGRDNQLKNETYDLMGEIEDAKYKIAHPEEFIDIDQSGIEKDINIDMEKPGAFVLEKPTAPKKPVLKKPVRPDEPVYQSPGLFNRKKVMAENEQKKTAFESQLLQYERELKQYEDEHSRYDAAVKDYKQKKAEYSALEKEYMTKCKLYDSAYKKAYDSALKFAVNASKNELKSQQEAFLGEKKQVLSEIKESLIPRTEDLLGAIPQLSVSKLLNEDIKGIKKELQAIVKVRDELYSYNVIYGKYRNYVALTTIYEYLDSGRCDSLDGPQGAYNLYESELRSNEIIVQLKTIVSSLETIKANQYMLYNELKHVNRELKNVNSSVKKAISEINELRLSADDVLAYLSIVSSQLGDMESTARDIRAASKVTSDASIATAYNTAVSAYNTAATAKNTALSAYYSAVTAHYSKVNSELTNALGFLVALK